MVVTQAGSSPPRGQYNMVTGVCLGSPNQFRIVIKKANTSAGPLTGDVRFYYTLESGACRLH